MLARTLQRLIDQKLTTAREIGELAGVSTSTVYRWVSGESQPDFNSIRLLLRHLPEPAAQEAILALFTAGTCWWFIHSEQEQALNGNGHGCVDAEGALSASATAVKLAADSLSQAHLASRSENLPAEEAIRLVAVLNHVVCQCTATQRVLADLAEKPRRRSLKLAK